MKIEKKCTDCPEDRDKCLHWSKTISNTSECDLHLVCIDIGQDDYEAMKLQLLSEGIEMHEIDEDIGILIENGLRYGCCDTISEMIWNDGMISNENVNSVMSARQEMYEMKVPPDPSEIGESTWTEIAALVKAND